MAKQTTMNRQAVLVYISKTYLANQSQSGMQQVFDKVKAVYAQYQKTGNLSTMRYLLALCIRARHGRRMPWCDTRTAVDKLLQANLLSQKFSDFDTLYKEVKKQLNGIHFAQGPLTVYDTALNLGQLFTPAISPTKTVYLSAGAWDGAVFLIGKKNVKPTMPTSTWRVSNLFPTLDRMYIEDVLCICKSIFEKLSQGKQVTQAEVDACLKICPISLFNESDALQRMGYVPQP